MSKKPVIVFEGIEGSGKSYHLSAVSRYLKKTGFCVHESDVVVSNLYKKPNRTFVEFLKKNISNDVVKRGKINKKLITKTIFKNKKIKKKVEAFIHKEVACSRADFIKKNTNSKKKNNLCRHTAVIRKKT